MKQTTLALFGCAVPRTSAASFARNREMQRDRNKKNNKVRNRSQYANNAERLERRKFVGWDGEGYRAFAVSSDGQTEIQHRYMLFGASTGHYTTAIDLSTQECLDLILYVERQDPSVFHVGFSFEYDVNMILRDLEWRHLAILHDTGVVKWRGYRIKHTPHKSFTVSKNGTSATIYDVFGFFHTSYLGALSKFGIGTRTEIERIETGKKSRSSFTYSQIEMVTAYWSQEMALFSPLMDKLRESCYDAGFFITQWHGPGALASYVLKKHGVYGWQSKNVPKTVQIARRLAYAGGRFQGWKCGYYDGAIYTADINSAYAYACSKLPRLDNGRWQRRNPETIKTASDISHFALYRIRFDARKMESQARNKGIPYPLFHRDKKGYLTWPPYVENWYWSPEAALVAGSEYAQFLEVWEYVDDGSRPFDFVQGAYDRRLSLQASGNYAEKAYKWFLASIYGQFAQRVGWNKNTRKPPRSHCLEWAGYITSYCRAFVYRAAIDVAKRGGLISIDTDGVTSTVPFNHEKLPNGVGANLGAWKLESFTGILYWQNGIYWMRGMDGRWVDPKTRGIPKGSIKYERARSSLEHHTFGRYVEPKCNISLSRDRFIGYRQALQHQWYNWRHWKRETVAVQFGGTGKGRHVPKMCPMCQGVSPAYPNARMHTITHFWPTELISEPHNLPWLKPPNEDLLNVTDMGIWKDDTI